MKLERISPNQIKYSITFEELSKRGFIQEEMLKESFVWDDLFEEMLEEASKEYKLDTCGAVSIEIFSLTTQDLVLIVTLDDEDIVDINDPSQADSLADKSLIFVFDEIDGCILLAKSLHNLSKDELINSLYSFEDSYYLLLDQMYLSQDGLISLCEEYGELSTVTPAYLMEYGNLIVEDDAIKTLNHYF